MIKTAKKIRKELRKQKAQAQFIRRETLVRGIFADFLGSLTPELRYKVALGGIKEEARELYKGLFRII